MQLLKQLCSIHAPSGNEGNMTTFLLNFIEQDKKNWLTQPKIFSGEGFQNCIVLVFGKPRTAIFAHIDTIGFTVGYPYNLIKIGIPKIKHGYTLVGNDDSGYIECKLQYDNHKKLTYSFKRPIIAGTDLSFKPDFRESENYVQCCYLDNRLGVWNVLQTAKTLKDGIIIFSCWEEHGGGSVGYLTKFIYEKYNVTQALISDITWITDSVKYGEGVVVSIRDSLIPRQSFVKKIIGHAKQSGIPFQLEVQDSGGSDGTHIQASSYPVDWCFVGAPEDNVHTPDEKVHKKDIGSMVAIYQYLMLHL